MEFHNFFTIYQTALDVAKAKGHQKIVELLSQFNQNQFGNPLLQTKIENHIKSFFPNTDASTIELITSQILTICEEQVWFYPSLT